MNLTFGTKVSAWLNAVMAVIGGLMTVNWNVVVSHPSASAGIVTGLGIVNTVLHMVTGQPDQNAPKS